MTEISEIPYCIKQTVGDIFKQNLFPNAQQFTNYSILYLFDKQILFHTDKNKDSLRGFYAFMILDKKQQIQTQDRPRRDYLKCRLDS